MSTPARSFGLLCVVLLSVGVFAGTAAATDSAVNSQFIVELDTNGDANVVFTETFDLTDPEDRAVFEDVRDDEAFRQVAATQLQQGMQSISDETNQRVDRELDVGDVTIETVVDGETGIVGYQFRWANLAVVDGDRVVLSEPFSTYDALDRELIVLAPEGYELTSISPEPARQGEDVASWPGFTEFGEDFEVVATAPDIGTYGSGPIALGGSLLLLTTLFIGRDREHP